METSRMFNIEAENNILGAILNKNDTICDVIDIIEPNDFYKTANKIIYTHMKKLYAARTSIDLMTLVNSLQGVLSDIGGITYISELLGAYSFNSKVKDHAIIVKEKSNIRKLNNIMERTLEELQNGTQKSNEIINSLESESLKMLDKYQNDLLTDSQVMSMTLEQIQTNYENGGGITGIETGLKTLDFAINGLQKQKLYVVAGRPGMCKSALALNICQNVSKDKNVLYYSLEMPAEELGLRRLAMTSFIDSTKIERGKMNDDEWGLIGVKASNIASQKCITNCKPNIHINAIKAQCKKTQLQGNLDLLVIDYIGLMNKKGMGDNSHEQVTNLCIELKNLSKEFNIPVIILSQLNRGCEARPDKRPLLSDLKDSGGVEENADAVILLYRDEYYNKDTDFKNMIECNIAKQRGGRCGVVKLGWKPEYQKITDKGV